MPIYEYEPLDPRRSCRQCAKRIEVLQRVSEPVVTQCPSCGAPVRRVISWCRAAIVETSKNHQRVEKEIGDYEKAGMWSHAAELADKHSEKMKDAGMRTRALDNYKKAGYDLKMLEKHAKISDNE